MEVVAMGCEADECLIVVSVRGWYDEFSYRLDVLI